MATRARARARAPPASRPRPPAPRLAGSSLSLPLAPVEQGRERADLRQPPAEVEPRRRRGGRPLQRLSLPRVVTGWLAMPQRDPEVDQEDQDRQGDHECPDRRDEIEVAEPARGRVVRN